MTRDVVHAVVSDLDGTLLNAQHQITPYSRRVLRALAAQGITPILASGRPYADVEPLRAQIDLPMFLVTSNGAQVYDPEGELMAERSLAPDIIPELVALGREAGAHINIYQGKEWLVEQPNPALLAMHQESGFTYRQLPQFDGPMRGVTKLFFDGEPAELQTLEQRLLEAFGNTLTVAFSLPNLLEVMAAGVNKWVALQPVLAELGIDAQQVIAFGDGLNDREMLEGVGQGLMMANAHPRLKLALAGQTVIGDHCDDAVACYLQKHLLRDEQGRLPVQDVCAPHPCREACNSELCAALRCQLQRVA